MNRVLEAVRGGGRTRPLVVAHRGDSAHAPENTIEAGLKAWEAGADAWEFDVQLTRDGVAVVIHDESLARTTDVACRFRDDPRGRAGYLVADFDCDEIRRLDAGSWFLDEGRADPRSAAGFGTRDRLAADDVRRFGSGDVRVPTLAECLALTRQRDWLANVELKSFPDPDPALLDAVRAGVEAAGLAGRVLVSSFDHTDVARAARAGLDWATGVLAHTPLFRPDRYVGEVVGADCYHASALSLGAGSSRYRARPTRDSLNTDALPGLRAAGIPTLVYTVNDARPGGLAAQLADAGVSGFFTDDPVGMLRGFGEG